MSGFRFHGEAVGNCFEVAAQLVAYDAHLRLKLGDRDEARVVHGLPVGRGSHNEGKRYWHAWVEVTRRARIPEDVRRAHPELLLLLDEAGELETVVVIDKSNGLDLALPRVAYYAIGGLGEDQVWRFPVIQARLELKRRGHYGPWVDDWESYEEVEQ